MQRRRLLKTLCGLGVTAWAAVLGVPIVRFMLGPLLRRSPAASSVVRRVAQLDQLPESVPKPFAILGGRQDAWTRYEQEVLGRVWLVRRTGPNVDPAEAHVDAYSAECPHLGCSIGFQDGQDQFVCPCHQAAFTLTGKRVVQTESGVENPAPRPMDQLDCRLVKDDQENWWVEVTFQKYAMGEGEQRVV